MTLALTFHQAQQVHIAQTALNAVNGSAMYNFGKGLRVHTYGRHEGGPIERIVVVKRTRSVETYGSLKDFYDTYNHALENVRI